MRLICAVALLFAFGCYSVDRLTTARVNKDKDVTTLQNLEYIDALSAGITHPLVCGDGRDYPNGRELVFRVDPSTPPIHAVFPDGEDSPESLDGRFRLYGYYQHIQNWDRFTVKRPSKDYQYFVVTSWKHEK